MTKFCKDCKFFESTGAYCKRLTETYESKVFGTMHTKVKAQDARATDGQCRGVAIHWKPTVVYKIKEFFDYGEH